MKWAKSFALYYGISFSIVSIAGLITTIIWISQVAFGYKKFSLPSLIVFIMVSGFSGLLGYALVKAGNKQTKI